MKSNQAYAIGIQGILMVEGKSTLKQKNLWSVIVEIVSTEGHS